MKVPAGNHLDGASEAAQSPQPSMNHPDTGNPAGVEFPIIGIGASAGGLAAFEQLFTNLPAQAGIAFVVVQHLSSPHKSILPEILQRYTSMRVSQVTDGVEVSPNEVYVIPPGRDMRLRNGHLALLKPETSGGQRLPIDFFFRSLAADQGAQAIGIVLSGTGSDGSLGLKTIKAEGGLTIAQEPETAEFGDMPRNAIATHDVDFVLPPQKMGGLVLKFIRHQVLDHPPSGDAEFQIPGDGLQNLYSLLHSKTGHDFSMYKQSTLLRRIERRIKINLQNDLNGYIDYIRKHPEEIEALFQEMLINVTHFFRDPEAFAALVEKAIRPLILRKETTKTPLRVWVSGCSTGEEAYSIAIAIQEQVETLKAECKVQIYATDLDPHAIGAARRGFYSDASMENVSAERLQRFFQKEDEGYQIRKALRDQVIFATHNLISDPYFSNIDLVSCRNVLIYLEHGLQDQLLLQFHYSLIPDGFLFLGNSESIGGKSELFTVVDRKHKIFRRKEATVHNGVLFRQKIANQKLYKTEAESLRNQPPGGGLREWMEKTLLEYHTPAAVIIDEKYSILYVHGHTGKYLEPATGEATANLVRMAREGLKGELATALHLVHSRGETVHRKQVLVKTNGEFQAINLTVRQLPPTPDMAELIMVVFEETPASAAGAPQNQPEGNTRSRKVAQLETAMKEKDEYLHTVINELEETNQDLKAANEELQSSNEELQSTNEELETAKEELQSINEELSTINAELQNKNEALTGINNDIYNLLASSDIGTIFVNQDLHIRRFTPAIQHIYKFLPTDIGRPLSHFVSNLAYDHLVEDIQNVLDTLNPKVMEIQAKNETWYLVNIKPYRTLEHVIDGAVITFVNITEQKQGNILRRLGTILRDSNDAITMQDFEGKILAWNRGAFRMYGWTETEALEMNVFDLTPKSHHAEVLDLYRRLAKGEVIPPFETQRVTRDGKVINVWIALTTLFDDARQPVSIALTERDITNRKNQKGDPHERE